MEGLHFGAGPWFAVLKVGADWQVVDRMWLSDGRSDAPARVEMKVELETAGAEGRLARGRAEG